jgi:hypothetical protein
MDSMEVSATCRWGRCHRETEHLVTHPIIGLVEVCGVCLDRFDLGGDVVADFEGGENPKVLVLNERLVARYLEVAQRFAR